MDGRGNGAYSDNITDQRFTSNQDSHELSLVSNNDGPFNYTFGFTYIDGDEPNQLAQAFNGVETGNNNNNIPVFYQDTSALCEASLEERDPGLLWKNAFDPNDRANSSTASKWGCHGSEPAASYSDISNGGSHVAGGSIYTAFYANVESTSKALPNMS